MKIYMKAMEARRKAQQRQRRDFRVTPQTISSDTDMPDERQRIEGSNQIENLNQENSKKAKIDFPALRIALHHRQIFVSRDHRVVIKDVVPDEKSELAKTRALQKRMNHEIAKNQIFEQQIQGLDQQIQKQDKKMTDLNKHVTLLKFFLERHHEKFQVIVDAVKILREKRHFFSFYNIYRDIALDYNRATQEEDTIH